MTHQNTEELSGTSMSGRVVQMRREDREAQRFAESYAALAKRDAELLAAVRVIRAAGVAAFDPDYDAFAAYMDKALDDGGLMSDAVLDYYKPSALGSPEFTHKMLDMLETGPLDLEEDDLGLMEDQWILRDVYHAAVLALGSQAVDAFTEKLHVQKMIVDLEPKGEPLPPAIVKGLLIKGLRTGMVGLMGTGKTSVALAIAYGLSVGRLDEVTGLAAEDPTPLRVGYLSTEQHTEILQAQLAAIAKNYPAEYFADAVAVPDIRGKEQPVDLTTRAGLIAFLDYARRFDVLMIDSVSGIVEREDTAGYKALGEAFKQLNQTATFELHHPAAYTGRDKDSPDYYRGQKTAARGGDKYSSDLDFLVTLSRPKSDGRVVELVPTGKGRGTPVARTLWQMVDNEYGDQWRVVPYQEQDTDAPSDTEMGELAEGCARLLYATKDRRVEGYKAANKLFSEGLTTWKAGSSGVWTKQAKDLLGYLTRKDGIATDYGTIRATTEGTEKRIRRGFELVETEAAG